LYSAVNSFFCRLFFQNSLNDLRFAHSRSHRNAHAIEIYGFQIQFCVVYSHFRRNSRKLSRSSHRIYLAVAKIIFCAKIFNLSARFASIISRVKRSYRQNAVGSVFCRFPKFIFARSDRSYKPYTANDHFFRHKISCRKTTRLIFAKYNLYFCKCKFFLTALTLFRYLLIKYNTFLPETAE